MAWHPGFRRPRTGPTLVCVVCSGQFYAPPSRAGAKYCGNACRMSDFAVTGKPPHNKGRGMSPEEKLLSQRDKRKRWRDKNRDAERKANAQRKKTPEGRLRARIEAQNRRARKVAQSDGTVPVYSVKKADVDQMMAQQCGVCFWTGDQLKDGFHIDHIVPLSKGGAHSLDNLCLATKDANERKSDKMPDVFWRELWDPAHVEL